MRPRPGDTLRSWISITLSSRRRCRIGWPSSPIISFETRIQRLDASNAEGQERLDEKHVVIDFCADQYKHDKTIQRLVDECAKYEEQPVVKQQFVAECQLAAFGYANALRTLKAEHGK